MISRKVMTTWWVGTIGVRPVRTTNVRNADRSAIPTANGAISRRNGHPRGSAKDGSNDVADVSAVVIGEIWPGPNSPRRVTQSQRQ